jgi:hypothetical protein
MKESNLLFMTNTGRNKEDGFILVNGTIHQEDITIANLY